MKLLKFNCLVFCSLSSPSLLDFSAKSKSFDAENNNKKLLVFHVQGINVSIYNQSDTE